MPMKKNGCLVHGRMFFPIFVALFSFFASATAFAVEGTPTSSDVVASRDVVVASIEGVSERQIGSDILVIDVSGKNLPTPEVKPQVGGVVEIAWKGASVPSKKWEKDCDANVTPLLSHIRLEQIDSESSLKLDVNKELTLSDTRGIPGGGRWEFRFVSTQTPSADVTTSYKLLPKPRYGGLDPMSRTTPITLVCRDTDIRDVFRMFAGMLKVNIVVDPSLEAAPVTLTFRSVPMNEAFGYLMRMYDFTYAIMGKTLIVGKADALGKTLGQEKTASYHIAYADLKALPDLLRSLAGVSNITIDERLRMLYVKARPEQLAQVEKTLQRIDAPGRQVMLQARILEVNDTAENDLESIIEGVYNHWWFAFNSNGASSGYIEANDVVTKGTSTSNLFQNPTNTPSTRLTAPMDYKLGDLAAGTVHALDAGLRILVNSNKGRVLASPSVIAVDGQKASVELTDNIKYISARDDAGNPTYSEERVGPTLQMTPTIGRDNTITLAVQIETGEVTQYLKGGLGEQVPETSTRKVTTYVRVRDGEPFVVGGLFKKSKSNIETRIPILSDIPLLGELFKQKTKTDSTNQVVMIVIPYILQSTDTGIEVSSL